jgi:hypothetical protein
MTQCTKRALCCCYYIAACDIAPLAAIWPPGDPNPRTAAMFMAAPQGDLASIDQLAAGAVAEGRAPAR